VTLPRLNALMKHWAKYPPVHVTAAVFAGITSQSGKGSPEVFKPLDNEALVADMHTDPRFLAWQSKPNG
jgi:hypothetical protein